MHLIEVTDSKTEKLFISVPKILYKNDPFWVCPLDSSIREQFDPEKNKFFAEGEAKRWVLISETNRPIGRISAFYNTRKARAEKVPSGGAGHFECINDRKAAFLLFDKAAGFLKERGLKAMDAPVNFGENDSNWGLLVEGFCHPGFGMPYNFPYYKNLFEDYGFNIFFRQYSYHLDLTKPFPERFWKIAEWVSKKPDYHFRHFTWKDKQKFIRDVIHIYNNAWSAFKEDFTPLDFATVQAGLKKARPILDPEMIWFAYHKDEPIGFFIMFPDANQILKKLNGRLTPWNLLKFIYYKKIKTITRIRAQVAGIIPKFQNSGIESGIFWHMNKKMKNKEWYKEIELSWVGDFNPRMLALYQNVGGKMAKIHHTYRYMLDPSIPFERFMPEKVKGEKLPEPDREKV